MKLKINNNIEDVSLDNPNIIEVLEFKQIPLSGTAVALNNKLVRHAEWETTKLNEGDELTVISAAFGG